MILYGIIVTTILGLKIIFYLPKMVFAEIFRVFLWVFLKFIECLYIPAIIIRWFRKPKYCPPIKDKILLLKAGELAEKIRKKEVPCETVIKTYIARIKEVNPIINAVIQDRFDEAIIEAKQVDVTLSNLTEDEARDQYPLLGVPITVKGSIAVKGVLHSAGLTVRQEIASEDAHIVRKAKEAGAIPLLVSNTPELCLNWETTNKLIGTTLNPYDTRRSVGGSSGGEVALLASGASILGMGSDIAGSLRLPAHFCGVFGHKPTPGLLSVRGHYPDCKQENDWKSVFTLGPMARHASDLKILLQIIAEPGSSLKLNESIDVKNIKVYYVDKIDYFLMQKPNSNVKNALKQVINHFDLISNNACEKISIPLLKYASDLSYLRLLDVDDVDNLFEGRGEGAYSELLKFITCRSRSEFTSIAYGLLRRWAKFMPKSQFKNVHRICEELKNDFLDFLQQDSVLIMPTYTQEAPHHGDVFRNIMNYGYCSVFNVVGFPVTNCPVSFTKDGLPVGLQVIAAPNCDHLTLAIAEEIEKTFGGWRPPPSS